MGNNIGGGRRKAKVMKINGETMKFKTPVVAGEVVKDYPGHVLLESQAVKQYGLRAKPLELQQELKSNKIYFLVELPKFPPEEKVLHRRVQSSIQMSAKDRLECLMLSRRSISDVSIIRPTTSVGCDGSAGASSSGGLVRVRMRLPKAQVAKLVEDSKDEAEVAKKIMDFYMERAGEVDGVEPEGSAGGLPQQGQWKPGLGSIGESFKAREKRVSFFPTEGGEQLRIG